MKIVKVANYKEWLEWRMTGIGGSDAPAVMNACKFQTKKELWARKLELMLPPKVSFRMKRGKRMEDQAREEYEHMTGIKMPKALVQHDKYDFLIASVDGMNVEVGGALEIKCPGAEDHALALKGEIPKHYMWQLVHILMVTGLPWIDYFSFDGTSGTIVTFKRDLKKEELLKKMCKDFWRWVLKAEYPEPVVLKKKEIFPVRKNKYEMAARARSKQYSNVFQLRNYK